MNDLNDQIVSAFAKPGLEYDEDTKYATDAVKQKIWEAQIQKELNELGEFTLEVSGYDFSIVCLKQIMENLLRTS